MTAPAAPRIAHGVIPLLAAVATAVLRTRLVGGLWRDSQWWVTSGDSWYHVWRIRSSLFPGPMPWHDAMTHAPTGVDCVWPPGFDWLAGLLARIGCALDWPFDRFDQSPFVGGYLLVALCAALTAWLAARIAMRLAPAEAAPLAGAVAGLSVAIHGGLHNYTQVGKIDHHAAEPLVTFAAVDALLWLVRAPSLSQRAWRCLVSAVALAMAVWMWPSSALTIGLLAVVAAGIAASSPDAGRRTAAVDLALAFAGAALLAVPLALDSPFGRDFSHVAWAPSWLQPALLATAAAALAAGATQRTRARSVIAAAGAVAVACTLDRALPKALLGGSEFVAGQGLVGLIQESMPVWQAGWSQSLAILSPQLLAAPLVAAWLLRSGQRDPARVVWAVLLVVTALLALTQLRFGTLAAVPLAVGLGVAAGDLAGRGPWPQRAVLAGFAVMALVGLADLDGRALPLARRLPVWQAVQGLRKHAQSGGQLIREAQVADALSRMRFDPALTFQGSVTVLGSWSIGHELRVLGGLRNIASPLIDPQSAPATLRSIAMHLATDDWAAQAEALHVRYWLTIPLGTSALQAYALANGERASDYVQELPDGSAALTSKGACTNAVALHEGLGSASPDGLCPHRANWRAVHVVPSGRAKVFEFVQGALVRGGGCPGEARVQATVRLAVNGEGFAWQAFAVPGPSGGWQLRLPWPSQFHTETVQVLGTDFTCGTHHFSANVTQQAVQEGLAVEATAVTR